MEIVYLQVFFLEKNHDMKQEQIKIMSVLWDFKKENILPYV